MSGAVESDVIIHSFVLVLFRVCVLLYILRQFLSFMAFGVIYVFCLYRIRYMYVCI